MVKKILKKIGLYNESTQNAQPAYPQDFSAEEIDIVKGVDGFTMTSSERRIALLHAVDYIINNNIEGDIVECGVWRGGSMLLVAKRLKDKNITNRKIFLYDTFDGMSFPTENDKQFDGLDAADLLKQNNKDEDNVMWCYAPLDQVKAVINKSNYPSENITYIQGKVEDTIPGTLPGKIALLRLDTDFYESTKHELIHLFPLLAKGGVIIIDDYGHWKGARQAVDEYIAEHKLPLLLNRIDYTGRIAVKL